MRILGGNMKKYYLIMFVVLFFFFIGSGITGQTEKPKYVGVKSCTCHNMASRGKQVDVWQKSKHASAFTALTTEEANKIAKEKGIKVPAAEASECLECHVAGFGSESFAEKYSKEEGITCESCHGAASGWKGIHSKKDKLADAIEAGLIHTKLNDESKAVIEASCRKCHNEKSPTFKEFKFDEFWAQIAHPIPQK
jgi:hypothetical protein